MVERYIGIQGGQGSFHEAAAMSCEPTITSFDIDYIQTFHDLFEALQVSRVHHAYAAIANNRYGFIPDTYHELTSERSKNIWIAGETYVRVEHQLLGIKGSALEDIQEVHSQAPALGQSSDFLRSILPNATLVEQDDTALSAQMISEQNDPTKAAIASARAGTIHGLDILASNIQDDVDNITRFLVLEKRNGQKPDLSHNKSTVLLTTGQNPGSLLDALIPFKEQNVNISLLHSTFVPNTGFDMRFFLEFDAGKSDIRTMKITEVLVQQGCDIKYLGSYSSAVIPIK